MLVSDEPTPSIPNILQMRAWRRALFTTYTLSLSYFESEVLRPLLRAGCSDIWLIADAEGYRSSLLERRSMRVGQEYRLIPVALPKGVFHAKCAYLASDDGDLLLIGSGNVTFGGHGKNAEVFEALSPETAATAFHEFADFLEATGSRPDITIARSEWVEEFAARARFAADRGGDQEGSQPVRLVHPLNEPVVDQLQALLAGSGSCAETIVMSPYHDPDGFAIQTLARRLNVKRTSVAVTSADKSSFPFDIAATWARPAMPVKPANSDGRFVHAKWFEFETASAKFLFTGSINATRKALTTIDNVELGVLRRLPARSRPMAWEPANLPAFDPHNRMPSGLKENEIVYATFDRDDARILKGRIISLRPLEGLWSGRLIQADGDTSTAFDVLVDASGDFAFKSADIERFAEMPALQLVVNLREREARGWVHNDMFLCISGRRRLTAGALSRLLRREASDDDVEALLDYLSMHAEQHLRIFDHPLHKPTESNEGKGNEERAITVSRAELAPAENLFPELPGPHQGAATTDQFDIAIGRLRRVLLGHGRPKQEHGRDPFPSHAGDPEEDGKEEPSPEERTRKLGLEVFEQEIMRLIKDAGEKPNVVRGLLSMSLEVGLWMRIHHLHDLDAAHRYLRSWFLKSCQLAKPDPCRLTSLQQHVVTSAAILFHLATSENGSTPKAKVHDALEHFYGGPLDKAQALNSLIADPRAGFAELLSGTADPAELANSLSAILSQRTTRQQLADAIALREQIEPVPTNWPVFGSPLGAELHKALSRPDWRKKVKRGLKGMNACVFERFSFSGHEANCYRRLRIGYCVHCKGFTLNLHP
jgi:hypothetical protein